MKHIYTLALAAAVAFGANAQRQQLASTNLNAGKVSIVNAEKVANAKALKGIKKAPAKSMSAEDLAQLNVWGSYGYLNNASGYAERSTAFYLDEETGTVTIQLLNYEVEGVYDLEASTVTLANNQLVGADSDGDIYFYFKSISDNGELNDGATDEETVTGTFEDGILQFPEDCMWALGDPDNEWLGWYCLCDDNYFYYDANNGGGGEPSDLISLGEGTFTDNILYPSFRNEENTEEVTVEVLTDGEGIYYVDGAFATLFASLGATVTGPALVLDATDPENIVIEMQSTMINGGNDGLYYLMSQSYYDSLGGEETAEEFRITKEVEGDNVTITFPYHSTLLMASATYALYYGSPYECQLKFTEVSTGVDKVESASEETPAVYYNLQGARVENPSNGIVIRVQNGKATKVLVK